MWANTVWGFINLAYFERDPFCRACFIFATIFTVIVFVIWLRFRSKNLRASKSSMLDVTANYDMPIAKAIDYVVNDSAQRLKRSSPPHIAEFGPARGKLLIEKGAEHAEAFRLLQEKVISGSLRVWGRRENPGQNGHSHPNFESIMREINGDYWVGGRLDYWFCFHESAQPQTVVVEPNGLRYTGLRLNSCQVRQFWKPESLLGKFIERKILRRPRLSYWSSDAPPQDRSPGHLIK